MMHHDSAEGTSRGDELLGRGGNDESLPSSEPEDRRSWVARLGTLVAGTLGFGLLTGRAKATHQGGNVFHVSETNSGKKYTWLTRLNSGATHAATLVLQAQDTDSYGLRSYGKGTGGTGVFGLNETNEGDGVWGFSYGGSGVCGESHSPEKEERDHGVGVTGDGGDFGVSGRGGWAGVTGVSDRHGVEGNSSSGSGVYGFSSEGVGIEGTCGPNGRAGAFYGDVYISGDLDLQGAKGAAVRLEDGSVRRLYSLECPESWFEDFGEGKLSEGRGVVEIDPEFRSVTRDAYHVFLTPHAECRGLYVSRRDAGSFEVRELGRGKGALTFSYRVVARRKDIPGPRFQKVKVPERSQGARPEMVRRGISKVVPQLEKKKE